MLNARKKAFFASLMLSVLSIQAFAEENSRDATPVTIKAACLKEEALTSSPQPNDNLSSTDKTVSMQKLDLKKIIIEIDSPDEYIFGFFPENNKNKIRTIDSDILRPFGKVTVYDIKHKENVSIVNIDPGAGIFSDNVNGIDGVLFTLKLTKRSQYLITPEIYVKNDKLIDGSYVFFIQKKGFYK